MKFPKINAAIAQLRERAEVCNSELSKLEIARDPCNPLVRAYMDLHHKAKLDLERAIEELEKMEELTK